MGIAERALTVDSSLGRGVEAGGRHLCAPCGSGTNDDDSAGPAFTHVWEDGVGDVEHAEEVGLELGERGERTPLFEHGLYAVAGVVDNDVDAAPHGQRVLDALLHDLDGVRDIELEEV